MTANLVPLLDRTRAWADEAARRAAEKGKPLTPAGQAHVVSEETGELCDAYLKDDNAAVLDGWADSLVTFTVQAHLAGHKIEQLPPPTLPDLTGESIERILLRVAGCQGRVNAGLRRDNPKRILDACAEGYFLLTQAVHDRPHFRRSDNFDAVRTYGVVVEILESRLKAGYESKNGTMVKVADL